VSWLVILRPTRAELPFDPTPEEEGIVGEHFAHLLRLRDEGKLVLAGPSPVPADTIGIAVFDVADEAEVRAIVDVDPAVVNGVMTAEIRPLRISIR
jgi:uncharacterized protein